MKQIKVAVIGAGPAGASASIYLSRAQLAPVMFAGHKAGGQLMYTTDVENYAGFPEGIKGPDLMIGSHTQAQKFGTVIEYSYVSAVDFTARPFKIWTNDAGLAFDEQMKLDDSAYAAHQAKIKSEEPAFIAESVVITTGSEAIRLGAIGEDRFFGHGVSVCAVCDAAFYKDLNTIVVGGGDSAMEDATALSKFAKSVTIIHRRDSFKASKVMQNRVLSNPKIKVIWNSQLKEIVGEKKVVAAKVTDLKTNTESEISTDGIFMAIGHRPVTRLFKDQIELDGHGYIVNRQSPSSAGVKLAGANLNQDNLVTFPTMTSVAGVFAAGDQVDLRYKQAIVAAGAGAMAALDAERWLETQS